MNKMKIRSFYGDNSAESCNHDNELKVEPTKKIH